MKIILAIVQDKDSNRLANMNLLSQYSVLQNILNRWILKNGKQHIYYWD